MDVDFSPCLIGSESESASDWTIVTRSNRLQIFSRLDPCVRRHETRYVCQPAERHHPQTPPTTAADTATATAVQTLWFRVGSIPETERSVRTSSCVSQEEEVSSWNEGLDGNP